MTDYSKEAEQIKETQKMDKKLINGWTHINKQHKLLYFWRKCSNVT